MKHALAGSLAVMLIGLVVFFILAKIEFRLGWIGVDSLVIMLAYGFGIWLLQGQAKQLGMVVDKQLPAGLPSLKIGVLGFIAAAVALVFITPWMVDISVRISIITKLGTTFIGSTLVALTTSLPELVATIAAARIGADDMAIGNLFGSNLFNMFALGLTDIFFFQGLFLSVIDPTFLIVGMFGLIMTSLALIGNLARLERRLLFMELDAFLLILIYLAGLWFLYSRGIG
jgi:cation:H+ antiporter